MTTLQRATYRPTIRRLSPELWDVQSASDPNAHYTVDAKNATCTCRAGQNGRYCWHLRAVGAAEWATIDAMIDEMEQVQPAKPAGMDALAEAFGPLSPAERAGWATGDYPF